MKHCPVSGLPITEKEHWSFEHRKGNYIRKYGLIGTDILHVQEIADHAITPEQLYTEDFTSLIAEENLTDNPLYLLMDCAPISGVSRSYKKEFTTLLLDAESPFRLIVLYNIDPAVRLQFELLQALEGTQRPVMLAESYNSATTAILEFKIGTTDAGKAEPQSKSLEEPALKQEFLTETATMLLRNHFDRNLFLPPEDHSAYPFFLILDLIRQDMKALEEEHRQTVERIEQEFRMLLDNFDVQACSNRGVWFSSVPDLLTIPTAELAIGLLINVARNMHRGNEVVKSGQFEGWRPRLYGKGLDNSTVGIIGMGRVGKAIATFLQGFNNHVIYSDPYLKSNAFIGEPIAEKVELTTLLSRSDFIIVATPYTTSTRHLINEDSLKQIKSDAFLINIGRGSCVNEKAISAALDSNQLAGYAADVFEFEDWARDDRPKTIYESLLESDKTYFTPHLGSAVDQVRYDIAMQAALNIKDVLKGKQPQNAINKPLKVG